ncbi:hypothetical protein KQ51_00722 [Candidatus Izimaplasma bacterium HR1]|jgi:FlaA1/EpsC-like NDP-sugar epimerase|uniref:winged helix-turn-helix domain-containing protein n=1 Tax=Candidatus Izimoplasma sp. HR1 TaxID=1541959 RepID=UPI0004F5C6A0|nr:hypothetical protein KQ51_00722 [Candidatus Izimaplasma bacterium HR1]
MTNTFFKPAPNYKEFQILDLIEKNEKITQRYISDFLHISVSMVNSYLKNYEELDYVRREYVNSKVVFYFLTRKGVSRKKYLNIGFLKSAQKIYEMAKKNIDSFVLGISKKGYRNIYFYGAGEVAEILLGSIILEHADRIRIIGVIDDDINKQGKLLQGIRICSNEVLLDKTFDAIVVSSFTNQREIEEKLKQLNISKKNIIKFFR